MKSKMYLVGCGLLIFGLIHLAASSSSGTVTPLAITISTTPAPLSSSADDSTYVRSVEGNEVSTHIDNPVSTSPADSDRTSLVTPAETNGIHPISSISFQVSDFTSTTSPSRSIQTSSAHFTSDQQSPTSLPLSVTVRYTSGTDVLSQDISHTTKATPPLLATESLLSTASLDRPSFSMNSPSVSSFTIEEETSASPSLTASLSGTDQLSGDFSATRSTQSPASSPHDNDLLTVTSLVDNFVTISRARINVHSSEFGYTTTLANYSTPEHSTATIQQTSPLPLPTVSLQSLMNSAQESDLVVSSALLQPSTSRQLLTEASFNHSISGNDNFPTVLPGRSSTFEIQQSSPLIFHTSESLQPVEANSAAFETMHFSSDTQNTVNSQSSMTSVLSSDTIPGIETTPVLTVSPTASAIYSISSINEIIPSSILSSETSILYSLSPLSSMTERSDSSSSVGEIWTSLSEDVASSFVNDLSQMSPSATQQSSQSFHLDTSTQAFIGLDTSGMLYSFVKQSSPSVSSSEIPLYSDFSTIMSSSTPKASSLCAYCSTMSTLDLNSTRTDPVHTLISESSLQNQTKSLPYSSTGLSLHTSEVSRLSTSISSILFSSSTLRTVGSNDSVPTPSILFSIPSLQSSLDVSPTSIDLTSVTMYHNMSTPVLTTPTPSSNYIKNLTLVFSLKGNCDFIMGNQYVFRKFWRSLLLYTEKASNLSIAQHDISLVETQCDPFRAVISISTGNDTINIAETISNYFHSNSSHSKIFLHLNNGTKIVVIITHYQFIPTITGGSISEAKMPLSEIVMTTTAAVVCGILIIFGLVIFIREYLQKRKSEGFRFSAESCPERVALRRLPRTSDVHGSSLEMKDAGSVSGAYNGPFESEYSTVGSQKGRKTDFMTRSDLSLSGRSKTKGRKHLSTGHATSTSSNGTARHQDTRGYGLVIGLLGYKPRSKEPADTYAVPSKRNKVQGLSIRSTEESSIEMPTLPREKSQRTDQEPGGSPTPPPRHLRSVPKHSGASDSIERLVPSGTKGDDEKNEGVVNLAYTDDDKKDGFIGSTPSVHL